MDEEDDCVIIAEEKPNIIVKTLAPVISCKRLKQATLPFQVLEQRRRSNASDSIRKRRLPEVPTTQRPAKNSKYEETNDERAYIMDGQKLSIGLAKCLVFEDDRGVSSSCETHCSRASQFLSPVCLASKDLPSSSSQFHSDEESQSLTQALEVTTSNIELDDDGVENSGSCEESLDNMKFKEPFLCEKLMDRGEITNTAIMMHLENVCNEQNTGVRISATNEIELNTTAHGKKICVLDKLVQKDKSTIRSQEGIKSTCMRQVIKVDSSKLIAQIRCVEKSSSFSVSSGSVTSTSTSATSSQNNSIISMMDQHNKNVEVSAVCIIPDNKIVMSGSENPTNDIRENLHEAVINKDTSDEGIMTLTTVKRPGELKEKQNLKEKRNERALKIAKEREEKENEREAKKRLKEEERQRKVELIEKEKKKKEEMKLEEKKKKEEEKRRKEEEKNDLDNICQKEKQLMDKFFVKSAKENISPKQQFETEVKRRFMDFEVKQNMRIAPAVRIAPEKQREIYDGLTFHLYKQNDEFSYLNDMRVQDFVARRSGKTWPSQEISSIETDSSTNSTRKCFMRAKLLQFHVNHRPAYYGTWSKTSRLISARHPLRRDDKLLDYDVDSDDEWEEEEPGESLSHSEGENDDEPEEDNDDDDDGDGFFVPHGYLSEDEGGVNDEEAVSPEKLKANQLAKARCWEVEMSSKRCEFLKPVCVAVCWSKDATSKVVLNEKLKEFKIILLESNPILFEIGNQIHLNPSVAALDAKPMDVKKLGTIMPVPESALPDLVRLVHGNKLSIQTLVKEFREYWYKQAGNKHTPMEQEVNVDPNIKSGSLKYEISKRQLNAKIRDIATYESRPQCYKGKLWYVNDATLNKFRLMELPIPTEWSYTSTVFKD